MSIQRGVSFQRGSLVWVDLGVGVGSEGENRRPAVVVSNDGANSSALHLGRGVITVVPMTTRDKSPYPFQVAVPQALSGLPTNSIARAEQVRSVDVTRLTPTGRRLPPPLMAQLNQALSLHLALW